MSYSHIKIPVISCDGAGCEAYEEGCAGQRVIDLRAHVARHEGWTSHPKSGTGLDDLCPACTAKRSARVRAAVAAQTKARTAKV